MCNFFTLRAPGRVGQAEFGPQTPRMRAFFPESHDFARPAHVPLMCSGGD
jgi:hypothetical protein